MADHPQLAHKLDVPPSLRCDQGKRVLMLGHLFLFEAPYHTNGEWNLSAVPSGWSGLEYYLDTAENSSPESIHFSKLLNTSVVLRTSPWHTSGHLTNRA